MKKLGIGLQDDIFEMLVASSEENGIKPSTRATQIITLYLRNEMKHKEISTPVKTTVEPEVKIIEDEGFF